MHSMNDFRHNTTCVSTLVFTAGKHRSGYLLTGGIILPVWACALAYLLICYFYMFFEVLVIGVREVVSKVNATAFLPHLC